MNQWIGPIVTTAGALLSAIFAIIGWVALREIRRKDKEIEDLQTDMEELLKIVVILENLEKSFERERNERRTVEEQLWSKANRLVAQISAQATTISEHQRSCRSVYMTQVEHDRLEALRDKVEDAKAITDARLDAKVENVIQTLNFLLQRNGMSRR